MQAKRFSRSRRQWHYAIAVAVLLEGGACSHPLTARTAQYAQLGAQAAAALQPLASVVRRSCLRTASNEFLQQRLLRTKAEQLGQPLESSYYVDEAQWYKTVPAIAGKATWEAYCAEMDRSAAAFTAALSAISTHAAALGALSNASTVHSPDWGALLSSARDIEEGLSKSDSHWLKFVSPLTSPIKELSKQWQSHRAEQSVESALADTQPAFDQLIQGMLSYLNEVASQLTTLQSRQTTLLTSFEILAGFSNTPETSRQMRCPQSNRSAATTVEPAGGQTLSLLCERSILQQREIDTLVLLLLHDNAVMQMSTTDRDLATVSRYQGALSALAATVDPLAKAARAGDAENLAEAARALVRLSATLSALGRAGPERTEQ